MIRSREERRVKKTRWWKLEDPEFREKFVLKAKQESKGKCMESWEEGSGTVRSAAKAVLGETSGNGKEKMETWWWCDEVQKAVLEKKEMKKLRDANRTQENIERYKKANKTVKNAVARAKAAAYADLCKSLDEKRL